MILKIADWQFRVDKEATWEHTTHNSTEHCECPYCTNYYEAVDVVYPDIRAFLSEFGINIAGPSELMPFTPTLMLACYRVKGEILHWGKAQLNVSDIPILPEAEDEDSFLIWVGEMELPWLQQEDMASVVSPANLPEFLQRMEEVWLLRHGKEYVFS